MLWKLLQSDLRHLYYFKGITLKKVTISQFIKSCFSPRFLPVVLYRLAFSLQKKSLSIFAKFFSVLNFMLFGVEIGVKCEIGPGLIFPHTMGTVIGAQKIGKNALIYHGVTIGAKEMDMDYSEGKRPLIGDNVIIGSGAKILGGIVIGNNVVVGANAVVTQSVPDNSLAMGIPAKITQRINTPELIT